MNILLVNDDGINSLGLEILEVILSNFGHVYVCAPSVEQSGKSASITSYLGLTFDVIDDNHISCNGTPADCVQLGMAYYKTKNVMIDLIVSGCNNGWNLANDIIYSGTCGAAWQGLLAYVPTIAFSSMNENYFNDLYELIPATMKYLKSHKLLSNQYFLNINFPYQFETIKFKITKLHPNIKKKYTLRFDEQTKKYFIDRNSVPKLSDENIDYIAVNKGYVSITPLTQNLFSSDLYQKVSKKVNN